jgi:hypothetical protein
VENKIGLTIQGLMGMSQCPPLKVAIRMVQQVSMHLATMAIGQMSNGVSGDSGDTAMMPTGARMTGGMRMRLSGISLI